MSAYGQETRVRPAAGWYLLPLALWVAAAVLAVVAWKPVLDLVTNGVHEVGNNATLTVPSGGLTVYATRQPSGHGCRLVDGSGHATVLSPFDSNVNWTLPTTSGATYFGLGSTPSDLPPGMYTLGCTGLGQAATLGIGRRLDIGDVTRVGLLGVIVPVITGLVGLVILIVLLVKRHNSKSRIKAARASDASGYPATWAGSGYPPPPPGS